MKRAGAALAGAMGCAILVPVALLADRAAPPPRIETAAPSPIIPSPAGSIDQGRDLFGGDTPPVAAPEGDADLSAGELPRVVGVVGRLPDRAVALVRGAGGGTRTIAMGESIDGWRLDSIAADAVLFTRGDRRARVEVATGAR